MKEALEFPEATEGIIYNDKTESLLLPYRTILPTLVLPDRKPVNDLLLFFTLKLLQIIFEICNCCETPNILGTQHKGS